MIVSIEKILNAALYELMYSFVSINFFFFFRKEMFVGDRVNSYFVVVLRASMIALNIIGVCYVSSSFIRFYQQN